MPQVFTKLFFGWGTVSIGAADMSSYTGTAKMWVACFLTIVQGDGVLRKGSGIET